MEQIERRLLLRPVEAAAALAVSRSKIYELIATGGIPSLRIGDGSIRVPLAALQAWIEARTRDRVDAPQPR